MSKRVSGIIGILLSIIVLVFFEEYSYKVINLLGINVSNYSNTIQLLINIGIKFIMCFIIYCIFKRDFRRKGI